FRGLIIFGPLLTATGLSSNNLLAAELSIPTVVASGGDTIRASILYSSQGAAVAALQFDLEYDPQVLDIRAAISGPAAAAGKDLAMAVLPNGHIRFVILGLNQNVITDGSVIDLTIHVNPHSQVGHSKLDGLHPVTSSATGEALPIKVVSGAVIRVGPPGE